MKKKSKKIDPVKEIKKYKKIAHTKKLPNIGYGMTSAPLSPATKKKIRKAISPIPPKVGKSTLNKAGKSITDNSLLKSLPGDKKKKSSKRKPKTSWM